MSQTIELEAQLSNAERVKLTFWQTVLSAFNLLNHILIVIVTIYMTCLTYNSISKQGNIMKLWHPLLCTIGYQLLMSQSIMSLYSQNMWSKSYDRKKQRTLHWVLQAIGSSIAIFGIVLEYISREKKGKKHFKEGHGLVGLIAAILTIITMLNGVSALWSVNFYKYIKPAYLKLIHNLNGIAAFVCGMVAMFLAYDLKYMKQESRPDIRMWLQIICVLTTILTLIGAARAAFVHIKNIFS